MTQSSSDSALQRALAETERVFAEVDKIPDRFAGFNPGWAVYDRVHLEVSLPLELRRLAGQSARVSDLPARPSCLAAFVRALSIHLPLFLYSLVNLVKLRIRSEPRVAVWTGDFYDPRNGGDFRLGNLYAHFGTRGASYVDFVRTHNGGLGKALRNARKRGRPAVYYESLAFFLSGAWSARRPDLSALPESVRTVLARYAPEISAVIPHARLFMQLFKVLQVRSLVAWEFSSRQAALIFAAKDLGLPVVGFMHGAGMRSYMAHEFLPARAGALGPDVFGVWSSWWKEYYERNAGIYGRVEVSGPMRRPSVTPKKTEQPGAKQGLRILWVSEPLLDPAEAVPWLRHLCLRHVVTIKKRPFTSDVFYSDLLRRYPEFSSLGMADGNIFQSIEEVDVVIGSHSTAVIDAALVEVPFILVRTEKWGDYFDLESFDSPWPLYVRDTAALDKSLNLLLDPGVDPRPALFELRKRFYGTDMADGSEWVALRALE